MNKNSKQTRALVTKELLVPFILVTSLFFLWGLAHSLIDVLNKNFQEMLGITRARSGLVQTAFYGAYFIMAIPAGLFLSRWGYKKGIIAGLFLYSLGAFLFWPASFVQSFWFTLFCLFVIASGLTFLETVANPYSSVLGPKETSEQRLTTSQSFNGLGWILGPAIGGLLIFGGGADAETNKFAAMSVPYMYIGGVVVLVAILFLFTKLPDIHEGEHTSHGDSGTYSALFRVPHFRYAVVALFLYVAAQTGIFSFFINFVTETMPQIGNEKASYMLSIGMLLFMSGRFIGSVLMSWIRPSRLLALYAAINVIAMVIVMANLGWPSLIALYVTYFCMSVMFPTIFALGLKGLGGLTKKGSSVLVMTIVGGALCPVFMGWIADMAGMALGFIVPLLCFAYIVFFALVRINGKAGSSQQG